MKHYDLLKAIGMLDGEPERDFDRLLELAASQLHAPVALLSIIDTENDRQFFKGALGLGEPWKSKRQTPLSHSFCQHVVAENRPMIVHDARQDQRVMDNLAVPELDVIAYLGHPIGLDEDTPIGALCTIESVPREWSEEDKENLRVIARAITNHIKLKLALRAAETARDEAEAAQLELVQLNNKFLDLANDVPGAIISLALHPDGRQEIDFVSDVAEGIWELPHGRLVDNPSALWDAIHPDDRENVLAGFERSTRTLTRWKDKWRSKTETGSYKWLQVYGTPRQREDGVIVWNSVVLDVTAEIQAQETLAAQQKLLFESQKMESIGRLAGGLAHDFNNLMYVTQANAELLMDDEIAGQRDQLQTIVDAAQHGSELTQRLLSFAGKSQLAPEPLDPKAAIDEIQRLFGRSLTDAVSLEVALDEDLPWINSDKSFFETALMNLLLNAREAISGNGSIKISAHHVALSESDQLPELSDLQPGQYVVVEIADSGKGIDPEALPLVFDPFYTTKGLDKGSGLGLPMVLGFARQSGGTAMASSTPGQGTTIRLYLAAVAKPGATIETKKVKPVETTGPATILFAEDHLSVREITTKMLTMSGFKVIAAESGDEAFELYQDNRQEIDMVLTDVLMPGSLQGPDLVAKIRELDNRMPAVFVSGFTADTFPEAGLDLSKDIFLTKAVSRKQLITAVSTALDARPN